MGIILRPLLKYPGGKSSELKIIERYLPSKMDSYIEPFVGGGALFFYLNCNRNYINDKSQELMLLYKYVQTCNKTFFEELNIIIDNWEKLGELSKNSKMYDLYLKYRQIENIDMKYELKDIINSGIEQVPMFNLHSSIKFEKFLAECLCKKFKQLKKNEAKKQEQLDKLQLTENIEAGVKASYYTYLRDVYNKPNEYDNLSKPRKVAIFLFIREYCFSSMFRFNRKGDFNVPYGGVSYNKKTLSSRKSYYRCKDVMDLLKRTELFNSDFYDFIKQINIKRDDFMFIDPPYDTAFSEYDKNAFGFEDQKRLANYLIHECKCRFMLIIKETEFIRSLYENCNLNIYEENKNYFVSFKNRNKKGVKHLIITNYNN